jgi:hypothetical protein
MKRLALMIGVLALAGVALATASARTDARTKICHRTTSQKTPYVKLSVSAKALRAHVKHAADIIPAPKGACPRSLLTANSGGTAFDVALTGEAESPAGDPAATGTATVRLRAGGRSATSSPRTTCRLPLQRTSTRAQPAPPATSSSR